MYSEETNSAFPRLQVRILKSRVELLVLWRVEVVVFGVVRFHMTHPNVIRIGVIRGRCYLLSIITNTDAADLRYCCFC
jgi:hypothetical protein